MYMSVFTTLSYGAQRIANAAFGSAFGSFGANMHSNSGGLLSLIANRLFGLSRAEREANDFTASQNKAAMDFTAQQNKDAMAFEERMADKQMAFQADQAATQWQRGVSDMKAAGLNPALAYGQGGASAMAGSSGSGFAGSGSAGSSVAPGTSLSELLELATLPARIKALNAETRRTNAEAEGKEIRNETEGERASAELEKLSNEALNLAYQRQNLWPAQRALAFAQATLAREEASSTKSKRTEQDWRNTFIEKFHLSPELAGLLAAGISSFGTAFINRVLPVKTLKLPSKAGGR